jgi:3-hydroxyacyl-CoA dehydrogenase/enoyl-CoA hydratase/3-hydroxybutyryl-CoA epimerase
MTEALNVVVDADGIVTATMNSPGRSMNVLNDELAEPLALLIERFATDASIKGLVLASGKKDFLAGADVDRLRLLSSA